MSKVCYNDKHMNLLALANRPSTELLVLEGTIRSSKTVIAIQSFYFRVKYSSEELHCIAAKDYDAIRDNILNCNGFGLLSLFPDVKLVREKIGSYFLTLKGADGKTKRILLAGYANIQQWKKILGKTIGCFLIDEVNIADKQFIDETFARQASADHPFQVWTLNGDDPKHFIYQDYINKCKPLWKIPASILRDMEQVENMPGRYYTHWVMEDNPVMTLEKIERSKRLYPIGSYYYKIKILGERGIAEGLVYEIFASNMERFLLDTIPKLSSIVLGVDFGGNKSKHAFTATGYGPNLEYVVHLETKTMVATNTTADQLCNEFEKFVYMVQKKYGFRAMECYCDSAEQTLINTIRNRVLSHQIGIIIKNAYKKPINDRIQFQLQLLSLGKLFFMRWNTESIDAYRTAVYDSRKGHENERLDNGTTDIDTLDSDEYTLEPNMKNMMIKIEMGLK
ncbi:MAG: hypothetical protein NC087_04435 [Anaeroplasma bactoclasticum]|nr:hypothetical protein [Anaeroplasma bactoclasticum]